jgi:hypothetical protein
MTKAYDTSGVSLSPTSMIQRGPSEVYDPPSLYQPPGTEPGPGRQCTDATSPRGDIPMEIGYPPPNAFDTQGMTTGAPPPGGDTQGWTENKTGGLDKIFPGPSLGTPPDACGWWEAPGRPGRSDGGLA